jgi:hypothetical protein
VLSNLTPSSRAVSLFITSVSTSSRVDDLARCGTVDGDNDTRRFANEKPLLYVFYSRTSKNAGSLSRINVDDNMVDPGQDGTEKGKQKND